jgi:hypothetical protein
MKTTYINRYGDNIVFEQIAENQISVSGYDGHFRVGYDKSDPKTYTMFDPSGGPYIEIGTDVGRYFDGKIGKQIVESINFQNSMVLLTTKS